MTIHHDSGSKIQVHLRPAELRRLERLRSTLDTSKSGVLRRGLEALERQLMDPGRHPALGIIGLVPAGAAPHAEPGPDAARDHDDCLVDAEIASWSKRSADRQPDDPE